jgi:hypothetical protein
MALTLANISNRVADIRHTQQHTFIGGDFTLDQYPFGQLHISFNSNEVRFTLEASSGEIKEAVIPLIPTPP